MPRLSAKERTIEALRDYGLTVEDISSEADREADMAVLDVIDYDQAWTITITWGEDDGT